MWWLVPTRPSICRPTGPLLNLLEQEQWNQWLHSQQRQCYRTSRIQLQWIWYGQGLLQTEWVLPLLHWVLVDGWRSSSSRALQPLGGCWGVITELVELERSGANTYIDIHNPRSRGTGKECRPGNGFYCTLPPPPHCPQGHDQVGAATGNRAWICMTKSITWILARWQWRWAVAIKERHDCWTFIAQFQLLSLRAIHPSIRAVVVLLPQFLGPCWVEKVELNFNIYIRLRFPQCLRPRISIP